MKSFRIPLRVVFYRELESWVAHCLEFDLCGDGSSKEQALESLNESIRLQVEESLAHDNPRNLFSPAPPEAWEKFFAGADVSAAALQIVVGSIDRLSFEHPEFRVYADDALAVQG